MGGSFWVQFSHFWLLHWLDFWGIVTAIPWSACHQQLSTRLKQVRQRCQDIDLAAVLGQATQPGLLEAELLLDHSERMLNLGADVSFGRLDQILQLSIWRLR